ncbi:hypothetical protein MCOR25_004760 [Pyricularia grisea]|nr:hypothetical protein MCOR25_004760 [Pyricularia grisea]
MIVFEEAGRMTEPEFYIGVYAFENAVLRILTGDWKQSPPFVMSKSVFVIRLGRMA